MGKPRAQLSVQISLFVEKDEEEAGEKKKCLNNAFFIQSACWKIGILKRPIGRLGYQAPLKVISWHTGKPESKWLWQMLNIEYESVFKTYSAQMPFGKFLVVTYKDEI